LQNFVQNLKIVSKGATNYPKFRKWLQENRVPYQSLSFQSEQKSFTLKPLCNKSEGRGFDSRWGVKFILMDQILRAALWPWGLTQPLKK
jgi:hypothetical protein